MSQRKKNRLENAKGILRTAESLLEVIVLTVAYYIVWRNGYEEGVFPPYQFNGKYVLMGVYALLVLVLFSNTDGFQFGNLRMMELTLAQCIGLFIINFVTYFQLCLIANHMVTPVPLLILMAVDLVLCVVFIYGFTWIYHRLYAPHNMLMIYGSRGSVALKLKMDKRRDKYRVTHLMSVEEGFDKICQEVVKYDAVILTDLPAQTRNDILKFCYRNRVRTYVTPKISDIMMRGAASISTFDTPLLLVKGTGLTYAQRFVKRAMDIVICSLAMLVAAPIMLIVAIAIKIEDGGPVFYKQKRLTLGGREFEILKFRSMVTDAEKYGAMMATTHDPRITKVGRVIRPTRIDELPQILNILKGDMSIVGPRPERTEHVVKYSETLPEFDFRLKVRGGLTGYAQIYGKYNTSAYDKLRLDMLYIENYSILMDIRLILMTLRIMLQKESTEGFDKVEENERLLRETLDKLDKEKEENSD